MYAGRREARDGADASGEISQGIKSKTNVEYFDTAKKATWLIPLHTLRAAITS
jgi:hypothetical protein